MSILTVLEQIYSAAKAKNIHSTGSYLDLAKYIDAKNNGKSLEYWCLARRRMYESEIKGLGL